MNKKITTFIMCCLIIVSCLALTVKVRNHDSQDDNIAVTVQKNKKYIWLEVERDEHGIYFILTDGSETNINGNSYILFKRADKKDFILVQYMTANRKITRALNLDDAGPQVGGIKLDMLDYAMVNAMCMMDDSRMDFIDMLEFLKEDSYEPEIYKGLNPIAIEVLKTYRKLK